MFVLEECLLPGGQPSGSSELAMAATRPVMLAADARMGDSIGGKGWMYTRHILELTYFGFLDDLCKMMVERDDSSVLGLNCIIFHNDGNRWA